MSNTLDILTKMLDNVHRFFTKVRRRTKSYMSRTRAGRKAHETKITFKRDFSNFAAALAEKKWKFSAEETAAIKVERVPLITGFEKAELSFDQAYGELSAWLGRAFNNISPRGVFRYVSRRISLRRGGLYAESEISSFFKQLLNNIEVSKIYC